MRTITDDIRTNILQEQYIPDHLFIYVLKGAIRVFDGNKSLSYQAGDACIARKNRLAKYELLPSKEPFEPILFCFDEPFLLEFREKHAIKAEPVASKETFLEVKKSSLIDSFIQSIKPYYKGAMELDEAFEDLKYEELLIILLKNRPELTNLLFDFRKPGKIDLEDFMVQHYKFNVSVSRFAYLTGRSLSAFKRDFKAIFNETPSRWLVERRLQEAYFLMDKKAQKPSDIYTDLGFESLSHFSTSFKKAYGYTPSILASKPNKNPNP
ncbi:AraC family transcriptional regulator [Marinilongibacter aquaticus]|uniref:helix-turn-helix domain-containing protein n=1 Tax=Marinilongibacter aquaticus TaxID=2975157 RepID=UPI0021BD42A7|nr:AraC family transcriptional regulator [Marinilongibacter aquaticus]UBM59565.1 AraC family transcriptional regulator [Marinilongibacter aquaticus]